MLKEFKEFAVKGNMIDLAVGVIIGGAFSGIVNSLVNDVIMPVLSIFTGKIDFTNLFITLDGKKYETLEAAQAAGSSTVNIGLFVTQLINFLILAFVVFILVKQINRLKKPVVAPVTTKDCPYCKSKIHIEATRCPSCTAELTKSK